MKQLKTSFLVLLIFTIMTGVIYPAIITGIGQVFFTDKINGSLIIKNGTVPGSELIGQKFENPEFFQTRPSSSDYDASSSAGSNMGPTNKKLSDRVKNRTDQIRQDFNLSDKAQLPSDFVFSSASGLDPHISLDSAFLQVDRIASIRNIEKIRIADIIELNSERQLPFYGERFVNVLRLNTVLESMEVGK